MDEFRNTNGYSFSWSQPYNSYSGMSAGEIYQDLSVREEMIRIDAVDNIVQNMLTYPDADAILNKIRHKGDRDD